MKSRSKNRYFSLSVFTGAAAVTTFAIISACTGSQAKAKPNIVTKDAPKPGIVAKIGGQEITDEQLIGDDKLDFFDLKKKEYELRMDRLNKLMVDTLIGAEAKKAGMSTDDYINKKVVGDVKVSDSEYKKFVAEKKIPEQQLNPQIQDRIKQYLGSMKKQEKVQDYLAKLTKGNPVEVYFQKPKMQVNVDPGNAPAIGSEKAPITIVEFSDFQCPFCSRAATTVHEIEKKYGNKVRIAFRNFPLPMHPDARPAAEVAMCVNEQGASKFWKFHDLAFQNQEKLDKTNLEKFAKDAGADPAKVTECVNSKKFSGAIQQDMDYGEKLGVKSTPTFFVNGQIVAGALPIENFSEIIDEELADKK